MYILTRSRVPAWVVPLATVVVFALVTAPALGDEPPAFTAGPVIEGPAAVGAELRIAAAWRGVPAPAQLYEWDRCDASGLFCDVVEDACAATHVVSDGDVGRRFRARVNLFNAMGMTAALTPLSGLVVGDGRDHWGEPDDGGVSGASSCAPVVPPAPPAAPVPPAAPPAAVPTGAPPAAVPTGAASPGGEYLRPFPTVRIAGYTVGGGARITLMSVRGGRSAVVRATCVGPGCRRRALPPVHAPARLRALERFFRAGTVLQIRVTAGATIGKYTSFRIRAQHLPQRVDRCLMPGRWAPVRCPAP